MSTAANPEADAGLDAGSPRTPRFMNFGTVAAIIRKDMRTLWPLAAGLAALTLVIDSFFHEASDFPNMKLDFGSFTLHVAMALLVSANTVLVLATMLFIVMLVQQDRAVDPINDWMYRPIRAGELAMAKVLTVLAVVLIPTIVGDAVYAIIHGDDLVEFLALVCVVFAGCVFFLLLGWLCSGPFQALLAALALFFLFLFLVSVSVSISEMDVFRPVAAPAADIAARLPPPPPVPAPPVPPGATRMIESSGGAPPDAAIALTLVIVVAVASAAIVLWLLLGRRRVLAARATFLGLYAAMILGFTTTIEVQGRAVQIAAPSTLEQRLTSFARNDVNGDSRLDKAEYQNVLNELGFPGQLDTFWIQRDRDGDGYISLAEIRPEVGMPVPPAASLQERMDAFTKHDADKDGRLTKDEYAIVLRSLGFGGQVEEYWAQRNGDRDRFITLEEYVPSLAPALQPPERPRPAPER